MAKKQNLHKMTNEEARALLESLRWPEGPLCAHCGSKNVAALNGASCRPGLKKCRDCRKQFTVTVGTIFESSKIGLADWMFAFQSMCASKKGISALQLQRMLELGSYETAWFMCHRIRHAMASTGGMLSGVVEVDETYVGGKPRPGGKPGIRGRGTRKQPVVALVERDGNVKTKVVADVTSKTLHSAIRENVTIESTIITEDLPAYKRIGKEFEGGHKAVKHSAKVYAMPDGTNSNTVESFFALIKRGVYGNFHHVSKKHLFRYCAEFEFRWNSRNMSDQYRALEALRQTEGKRLMYQRIAANA